MSDDDRALPARQDNCAIVRARLEEASRRIRGLRAVSRAVRFALLAHLVLAPWILLRALVPVPPGFFLLALLVVGIAGAAYGFLIPLPLSSVARLLDQRLALKERLQSALEVMHRQGQPLADALIHDAAVSASDARVSAAFPLAPPAACRYLLAALGLAAVLFMLPPLPLRSPGSPDPEGSRQAQAEQELMARVAEAARPSSQSRESPKAPREPEGRDATREQAVAGRARGDMAASFKDAAIASRESDFAGFLRKGDERLRQLSASETFPDLQGDYTESPYRAQLRRARAALREARLGRGSPAELERMMEELKRLDRGPEQQGLRENEQAAGDFGGKEGDPSDRRLEALDRALARLREKGPGRAEGGPKLRPAPEVGSGAADEEEEGRDPADGPRMDGQEKSSRPGRDSSLQTRDRPTPRRGGPKRDSALSGHSREGEQESYDTNLTGPGGKRLTHPPSVDVLTQYRQMAEEALSKERVPFNYREQVKAYFRLLERRP